MNNMKLTEKKVAVLAASIGLCLSQSVFAAQEEDSAYRWGRWAVLSPAAGGAEPYAAASMPGADYNAVPEISDAFGPKVSLNETPVDDPRDRPPPLPTPPVVDDPRDRPAPPRF